MVSFEVLPLQFYKTIYGGLEHEKVVDGNTWTPGTQHKQALITMVIDWFIMLSERRKSA